MSTTRPFRRSSRALFLILGAMTAFPAISLDIYLPAMPAIAHDLGAAKLVQLTIGVFLVGLGLGQMFYGPLSDRIGRRTPLFIGFTIFLIGSFGCAFAQQPELLIAARFVQALGASAAVVLARAIVADLFALNDAARFLSRLMLIMGLAPILAPLLGGLIVTATSWRYVFLVLACFGGVVAAAAWFFVPETRHRSASSTVQSESAIASYRAIAANGPLISSLIVGALGGASLFAYISNAPYLLMDVFGITPGRFGFFFAANAVGLVAAAQINRALLMRYSPRNILDIAVCISFALTIALLAASQTKLMGMWGVLIALWLLIGSLSFLIPNAQAIALSLDRQRTGTVSAGGGSLHFLIGAATASVSSLFHDGTATPFAGTLLITSFATLVVHFIGPRP